MRVIATSSSFVLHERSDEVGVQTRGAQRTYRPTSYSLDAMGESSLTMVRMPSSGRSGGGFTICASTCAKTLQ